MSELVADLPVWWANVITVVLFIIIGAACFAVPRDVIMSGAPDRRGWRDVRWWALALIATQLGIYAIFS